jgi:hypothetical protein
VLEKAKDNAFAINHIISTLLRVIEGIKVSAMEGTATTAEMADYNS